MNLKVEQLGRFSAIDIQLLVRNGAIETPCLVIDAHEIDRMLGLFRTYLPFVRLQYSVKANNAPEVIRHLHSRGVGFDVASAAEAELTTEYGVPPERLILSNAIHPRSTLEDIFTRGIPLVTVDNEGALRAIAAEASQRGKTPPAVLIRIRVPSMNSQLDLNTKFGCSCEQAVRLFDIARDLGVQANGVHFHVGTQCWDVETYRLAVGQAKEVLAATRVNDHTGRVLNIGGGMPDPRMAEKAGGLETFFVGLAKVLAPIHEQGFELIAEPGRVLVSSACTAVCTVVGRATRDGLPWLYLDDGIYGMFSAIYFERRDFRFETLAPSSRQSASYMIAGPTCDSIDTLGTFTLAGDPQPGSILIAPDAGAYSVSVKCHFNGFAHINTYLVNSSFCHE
ncbi:MAG: alanine racemase [Fimbriimonadaceae bacterium]|nr:alanine racemase [Fimbriimonadaceae bacterium]